MATPTSTIASTANTTTPRHSTVGKPRRVTGLLVLKDRIEGAKIPSSELDETTGNDRRGRRECRLALVD